MNWIDKMLKNKDVMNADDIIQTIAGEMYKETETWKSILDYPQFIQDIFYIIDYDTKLQMEGLSGFFESEENNFKQTYRALMNCGAEKEAKVLEQASTVGFDNDDCYDRYRELESRTALETDYDTFWKLLEDYVNKMK